MNSDQKKLVTGVVVAALVIVVGFIGSRIIRGDSGDLEPRLTDAKVDSIEIMVLESFPVQVNVTAKGNLPDGCAEIYDKRTVRNEDTFFVTITTAYTTEYNTQCTTALVPFEETVQLDVLGLSAGTYTVDVNGVTGTFTLDFDNVLQGGGKG